MDPLDVHRRFESRSRTACGLGKRTGYVARLVNPEFREKPGVLGDAELKIEHVQVAGSEIRVAAVEHFRIVEFVHDGDRLTASVATDAA